MSGNSNISKNPFWDLFSKQKANQFTVGNSTYKARIQKLNALKKAVEVTYRQQIKQAIYDDFKKPFVETDLTEVYQVVSEIKYAKKHLKYWLKKQKVETPMSLMGSSSWYEFEPKGVCLIMSPWNFPLNLTFGPLVSAIAAGNTVILKPSEMTPHTSKVMATIVKVLFDENEIALVEGDVEVSKALLELPFNHIFFTGAPAIGKIVMKAAAENLASVTLELGGKSPTVIDKSVNIKQAAKRIAWGKFMNSGQICVSPDYILIHEAIKTDFISELKAQIHQLFGERVLESNSYCSIVNQKHFNRLNMYLEDAIKKGAVIEFGNESISEENQIHPTAISNVSDDMLLMQEEIFGPIIPIKTYTTIDEAVGYINSKEKPLALYVYSKSNQFVRHVLKNTRAGSTCVNNNVLQFTNHNLPFGGSNNSGIGKSHGFFGFQEFSNKRSVLKQHFTGMNEMLFPPYTNFKQKLVNWTIKWF